MPRGICWDDLPRKVHGTKYLENELPSEQNDKKKDITPREFDLKKDAIDIGRRLAFGVVCGSITGASFGFVEILRDPKAMAGKTSLGTQKVIRFTMLFAGFFGTYHAVRKTLNIYNPNNDETNLIISTILTTSPLAFFGKYRPMLPYGLMLIALDAINGIKD